MADHENNPTEIANRWSVWRIDDNANLFVVRQHLSQEEAQRIADEFEARGHKQHYWIEPEADSV